MANYKSSIAKLSQQYKTKGDIHAGLTRAGKFAIFFIFSVLLELYLPPK